MGGEAYVFKLRARPLGNNGTLSYVENNHELRVLSRGGGRGWPDLEDMLFRK